MLTQPPYINLIFLYLMGCLLRLYIIVPDAALMLIESIKLMNYFK